jgi:hypothetical protein
MIILSTGMPRAGSGWYYNLTNDLIIAAGYQDGHNMRQRYSLGRPNSTPAVLSHMNADDVVKVCESRPSAKVIAIHLEAINHYLLSLSDLKDYLSEAGVKTKVWIPKDGERILIG